MAIIPNFVERLAFRLNVAPAFMLDYLGAQAFRATTTAFKLGIFTALAERPGTAPELAQRIAVDERGAGLLLDTLDALGYVKKNRDSTYTLTPAAARWLPAFSPASVQFFDRVAFDWWQHLEESVRRGGSAMPEMDDAAIKDLQAGMIALALMCADEIAARVKLPRAARRLVDLGGGHGLYSIRLCQRHSSLAATIVDVPSALGAAREMIAREHVGDRVSLREGNFLTDDFGSGYDVALMFNVVHYHLPDKNRELLARVARSLKQGGVLVIMDQMPGRAFGPTVKALFRLQALHLFNAVSGQTYTADQVAGWLQAAGLERPQRIELRTAMGHTVVTATKPRSTRTSA